MNPIRYLCMTVSVSALVGVGPATAQPCLSDTSNNERASGKLSVERVKDGLGRFEWHLLLSLAAPVCLSTEDPADRIEGTRSIHLVGASRAVEASMARHVGSAITVRGRPFPGHTPHHHAPIVMEVAEFVVP
jgi:hypothetical protein